MLDCWGGSGLAGAFSPFESAANQITSFAWPLGDMLLVPLVHYVLSTCVHQYALQTHGCGCPRQRTVLPTSGWHEEGQACNTFACVTTA